MSTKELVRSEVEEHAKFDIIRYALPIKFKK